MNVTIPSVSIFIKTWKEDLKWLKLCLQFLEKNWKEPNTEIVIWADEDCFETITNWVDDSSLQLPKNARAIYGQPWPDGYSHAMFVKASADRWCVADKILLLDSDAMLLEPCDTTEFTVSGLPVIPWISYAEHLKVHPMSPWQRVTEAVTKMKPWHHFMNWMPMLYHADSLRNCRAFIAAQHGVGPHELEAVFRSGRPFDYTQFLQHPITFNDYDVIGFLCSYLEPTHYSFRHLIEVHANPFRTYHSWTMWSEKLEVDLKKALLSDTLRPAGLPN
jgi:hypothetical protein